MTLIVGSMWRAKRARRRSGLPRSARGADGRAISSTPKGTHGRWPGAPARALTHAVRSCRSPEPTLTSQSSGAEALGWYARVWQDGDRQEVAYANICGLDGACPHAVSGLGGYYVLPGWDNDLQEGT